MTKKKYDKTEYFIYGKTVSKKRKTIFGKTENI